MISKIVTGKHNIIYESQSVLPKTFRITAVTSPVILHSSDVTTQLKVESEATPATTVNVVV